MSDIMYDFVNVLTILISFLGTLLLAYITTRFAGNKFAKYGYGQYIKIIDRIFLGRDKWICLIQIGKNYYIVGSSSHNMELIGQISEEDLVPLDPAKDNYLFSGILNKYINKRFGDRTDGHE